MSSITCTICNYLYWTVSITVTLFNVNLYSVVVYKTFTAESFQATMTNLNCLQKDYYFHKTKFGLYLRNKYFTNLFIRSLFSRTFFFYFITTTDSLIRPLFKEYVNFEVLQRTDFMTFCYFSIFSIVVLVANVIFVLFLKVASSRNKLLS